MKKLLAVVSIVIFCGKLNAQLYYGGNISTVIEKYYDGKKKEIRTGVNDISLSVPIGYNLKGFLFEITPAGTLSGIPSVSGLLGIAGNFSDNAGFHFLLGAKDEMEFLKHWSMRNYFHPSGTLRIWINTFSIESKYVFRKEIYGGSSFEIGVGVIGF